MNYVKENIEVLGIAGDGQLARFVALAAHRCHLKTIFLTLNEMISPCQDLGELVEINDWNDQYHLEIFLEKIDVLILENEFVSTQLLELANKKNIPCLPNLSSYKHFDNKYKQALLAKNTHFLTPNFCLIHQVEEIDFSQTITMLKAIRGGYDGYGNLLVTSETPIERIQQFIAKNKNVLQQEYIDYDFEFSLIAARDYHNNIIFFPTAKTVQENHICHFVVSPADIAEEKILIIKNKIQSLLENINAFGLFAFEFFYKNGDIFFNEIAPRPHNSGHFTMDNCDYSQFDALINIILGKKLTTPHLLQPHAIMLNLLGTQEGYPDFKIQDHALQDKVHSDKNLSLYLYQKKYSKPGRKMGHITLIGHDQQKISHQLQLIKEHYTL